MSSLSAALDGTRTCGPGLDAVVADPPAIDPSFEGASVQVQVRVRALDAFPTATSVSAVQPLRVALYRDDVEVTVLADRPETLPGTTLSATWDGQLHGAPAPRGAYTVRVRYGCDPTPVIAARVNVVRVGVSSVTVGDGDGARIPMLWHKLGGVLNNYWLPPNDRPVLLRAGGVGVGSLDLPSGAPTTFQRVSSDLSSPPLGPLGDATEAGYNLPFALRFGTRPDVTLGFGLADDSAAPARIRATIVGAHGDASVLVADGASATYRMDDAPAPRVGRYDLSLQVRFEAERPDHVWREFAAETLPLRAYGILGDQTFSDDHAEPNAPWLAVVDAVAGWVDGSTADPHEVAGIIVHRINETLGLRYDTRIGAAYYTSYRPNGYSDAHFDLTGFIDRSHGSTVNCSDCASIVATYANMVGCDLGYAILTNNFPLNYIRAIGTTSFTNDPFHRGGSGGFSYHAITTPSHDGTDIFDATLVEDGDDHPEAAPFVDLTPDGLNRNLYLTHLSPRRLTITHDDKTSIE